jgi:hypothetical protein
MDYCCRIFTPVQPVYPAASLRDFLSGAYTSEYHAKFRNAETFGLPPAP